VVIDLEQLRACNGRSLVCRCEAGAVGERQGSNGGFSTVFAYI